MSTSWYGGAIIGCYIPSLMRTETRPRCPHVKPPEAQFCPTCGTPVGTITIRTQLPCVVENDDTGHTTVGGLTVFRTRDYIPLYTYREERARPELRFHTDLPRFALDDVLVGFGTVAEPDTVARVPTTDIEQVRAQVQAALEPLGLWDPSQFGVWAFCRGDS